jgi:hypothetical protein
MCLVEVRIARSARILGPVSAHRPDGAEFTQETLARLHWESCAKVSCAHTDSRSQQSQGRPRQNGSKILRACSLDLAATPGCNGGKRQDGKCTAFLPGTRCQLFCAAPTRVSAVVGRSQAIRKTIFGWHKIPRGLRKAITVIEARSACGMDAIVAEPLFAPLGRGRGESAGVVVNDAPTFREFSGNQRENSVGTIFFALQLPASQNVS